MAENLRVSHYHNGDIIPYVTNRAEWSELVTGACDGRKRQEDNRIFGYFYNFYAAADKRNIAPEGWHVPTDDDWKELIEYL